MTQSHPRTKGTASARAEYAEHYERIVESTVDLVTVVDDEGRFLYVNGVAEQVFGIPAGDCIGRRTLEFVHHEDRESTEVALGRWFGGAGEHKFEFENRQVDGAGNARLFQWTIACHELESGKRILTSIGRDITEANRATQALEANETRLTSLLAGMLDTVVTIDPQGIMQGVSDSVRTLFGYEPEELTGRNVSVLMPEPYRSNHDEYLARYRKTGETWILGSMREFKVLHKDGHLFDCELSVSRIDIPGREEPLFCGAFRDATERKSVQRALEESERRFRAIFDQEYQLVGLLEPTGRVLEINQTALDASGVMREQVVGRQFWDTPLWAHEPQTQERMKDWIARVAEGEFVRTEVEYMSRCGETRTLDFSLKAVRAQSGDVVLIIPEGRDITELKQAQQRETGMLKSLAAIGESAALLAHEIKNPITSVNVALRAVAKQLGTDEQMVLVQLVERMQNLKDKMLGTLSFVKPHDLHLAPCDTADLLGDANEMLCEEATLAGIESKIIVAEGCPGLNADRSLLEQVLTNLVKNAIEACAGPGHIELRAELVEGHVQVTIDDDGPGIPAGVRTTLFSPFTTTKDEGTGLGLALCRKIVEEHNGTIQVGESPLGGARFTLCLPAAINPRTASGEDENR